MDDDSEERPVKTIEIEVEVTGPGNLTVPLPPGIHPGKHTVLVVVDEATSAEPGNGNLEDFPVAAEGRWPQGLSLSRKDLYDDAGR